MRRLPALLLFLVSASLLCAQVGTEGVIRFANLGNGVDAPFFGVTGTNRLAGSNYVAALYVAPAGSPATALSRAGSPQPFGDGPGAGYWLPANISLPGIPLGATIRVQVRFWDRSEMPTADFEQAEAGGAAIGVADIPSLTLNTDPTPTPLFNLQSASLIPTLTLSRGTPRIATDSGTSSSGARLDELCGVPVGTNRWFRLASTQDAIAVLNTDFSSIDTVMAAFTGSIVNVAGLVELACNDDRSPAKITSAVTFPVQADTLYLICVAGKNGASGPVRLNYGIGVSLEIHRWSPGADLEIRWPADAGEYQLEASTHPVVPDSWRPVSELPILLDAQYVLPLRPSGSQCSFRLRALP